MADRDSGKAGEQAAERELRRMGMTLLDRNVRAGGGEIDLVALDRKTIVFVEVKSRRTGIRGAPAEAVDSRKQKRIVRAARAFLKGKRLLGRPRRYDIASVKLDPAGRPESVRWLRAAFDEGEVP